MSTITLLILFWTHTIADFVLQTDKMALNKSTSLTWLGSHVMVYSTPFLFFGWKYALVNGVLHFLVDFITSRLTGYFWKKGKRHEFFVVIGVDQALHLTSLVLTYNILT